MRPALHHLVLCLALAWPAMAAVQAMTAQDIRAVFASPQSTSREYMHAAAAIAALDPAEQNSLFRSLVIEAPPDYAWWAARMLMTAGDTEAAPIIAEQMTVLPEDARRGILQTILRLDVPDPFIEVPRTYLNTAIAQPPERDPMNEALQHTSAVEMAAFALSSMQTAGDRSLLRETARTFSDRRGVWIALARANTATEAELTLASTVWKNEGQERTLRTAAALVASRTDPAAASFAEQQITKFIDDYKDESWELALAHLRMDDATPRELASFNAMRTHLIMVAMLRWLDTDNAKSITMAAATVTNSPVRSTAGLIAAERWPTAFIEGALPTWSEWDRARMLVRMESKHAEAVAPLMADVDPIVLEQMRTANETAGVLALFPMGASQLRGM